MLHNPHLLESLPNHEQPQTYHILGHRGARAEWLENSEAGFGYTQSLQADGLAGVEFDIQMTADGQFVVAHDETLQRLGNQQAWIGDKNLSALTSILQSDNTRYQRQFAPQFLQQAILPLASLLPYLQGFCHIELEIKTHKKSSPPLLVKNLLRLLSKPKWQALPITLTSFDTEILTQLQLQQPILPYQFPTGLLLEPATTLPSQIAFLPTPINNQLIFNTFNLACRLGCSQVGVYYPLITPNLVAIAKRFGLKVTAWTVNEVKQAKKLVAMGVNCVITDYPSVFLNQVFEH